MIRTPETWMPHASNSIGNAIGTSQTHMPEQWLRNSGCGTAVAEQRLRNSGCGTVVCGPVVCGPVAADQWLRTSGPDICRPRCLQAQIFAGPDICRPRYLHAEMFAGRDACRPRCLQAEMLAGPDICRPRYLHAEMFAGRDVCRPRCLQAEMLAGPGSSAGCRRICQEGHGICQEDVLGIRNLPRASFGDLPGGRFGNLLATSWGVG